MKHFRFRHKRVGYMRWRYRAASRRALLITMTPEAMAAYAPSTAVWRRDTVDCNYKLQEDNIFKVGDYEIGREGDPRLFGHPDIKY